MKTYRHALVVGLGGSGAAAAELLRDEGADVVVIDAGDHSGLQQRKAELEARGIRVMLGAKDVPAGSFDVGVVSPGIPVTSPWILDLRQRGIPVISELELGWSRRSCKVVAVTGSNGKSTVVKWMVESLQAAGLKAAPAGNYGPAVSAVVRERRDLDWLVLEVSSFQMESAVAFRPEVGILLNINPNHLDRHGDMQLYTQLKSKMFSAMHEKDVGLVPLSLLKSIKAFSGGKGRWRTFGAGARSDFRYEEGQVWANHRAVADFRGTYFGNEVLGLAAAAVVGGLQACGVDPTCAVRAAHAFKALPHRMELIAESRGIRFVNDSKATNLSAMAAALRMMPGNARLIAGGLVKEKDFSFVKELLVERASGVYLIGQASEEMSSAWSGVVPCFVCGTLDAALRKAWNDARAGETILLSPACASFDQFRNYEERGDVFRKLVMGLVEESET